MNKYHFTHWVKLKRRKLRPFNLWSDHNEKQLEFWIYRRVWLVISHGDLNSGEVSPFSPQDVGSTFQNQIVKKWLEIFPIFFQILVEGSFLDQKQKRDLKNIEISAFEIRFSKSSQNRIFFKCQILRKSQKLPSQKLFPFPNYEWYWHIWYIPQN